MSKNKSKEKKNAVKQIPEEKQGADDPNPPKPKKDFHVVGIGASAGGLEAMKEFFTNMPVDSGMAFMVVSHMPSDQKSLLGELLRKYTGMELYQAEDGMEIMPNSIYVIPPGRDMAVHHRIIQLYEPGVTQGVRHTIDFFFRSLSKDVGDRAIGIVLSGTGAEGTQGIRDIKGEGGLVIVQSPESAKYEHMPVSAINTGLTDIVLPPGEMPEYLIAYVNRKKDLPRAIHRKDAAISHSSLQKLLTLVRDKTGNDFSLYKKNTILRRIGRRMTLHQLDTIEEYVRMLRSDKKEIKKLNREFLINVTNFFRDPKAFKFMKEKLLPEMLKNISPNKNLRIWVPGCSTGEEAYSIAMIFREYFEENNVNVPVKMFATDLAPEAIEHARQGLYPSSIAVDVSEKRLKQFFKRSDSTYTIREEIRNMIVFAPHNAIKDPPFSRMDLISCRNLLIYLEGDTQDHLVQLFHYALKNDRYLMLGTSESIGGNFDMFSIFSKKWRVYRKKPRSRHYNINLRISPPSGLRTEYEEREPNRHKDDANRFKRKLEKMILEKHAPPCLVIDENGDILYLYGKTGKFLEPAPGQASLNVFDMARKEIRREIKVAVRRAQSGEEEVTMEAVPVKVNGDTINVNIVVQPLKSSLDGEKMLMILFREVPGVKTLPLDSDKIDGVDSEIEAYVGKLEKELMQTRESLQNTIEDLDTSNEELKSANEELQSMNEELQSTNEELETSKEELQSVNEELVTLNAELQAKVEELTRISNDMENLLASTNIATIFLDNNMKIKRFTPEATKIIKLIQSDVGRPISDLKSSLAYEDLVEDVEEVLTTLNMKTREIQGDSESHYLMKIMPYRTTNNVIDGVVVVFMDITSSKEAEKKKKEVESRYHAIFRSSFNGIALLDRDTAEIVKCNNEFQRQTGRSESELKRTGFTTLCPADENEKLEKIFADKNIKETGKSLEISLQKPDSTITKVEMHIVAPDMETSPYVQCITRDVTGRKQAKDAATRAKEISDAVFEAAVHPLLVLDNNLKVTRANKPFYEVFNTTHEDAVGRHLFGITQQKLKLSEFKKRIQEALKTGEPFKDRKVELFTDGLKEQFSVNAVPLFGNEDKIRGILLSFLQVE